MKPCAVCHTCGCEKSYVFDCTPSECSRFIAYLEAKPCNDCIAIVGRRPKPHEPTHAMSLQAPVWAYDALRQKAESQNKSLSSILSPLVQRAARRLTRPITQRKPRVLCDVSRPACSYTLDGGTCTVEAPLIVPARSGNIGIEKIPSRYCLIEIDDLLSSHTPLTGFGERPGYPKGAQERDYRLPVEQAKVASIAEHYEPSLVFNTAPGAIDGVPVVSEQKIVLGGNGRTMATMLVYHGQGSLLPDELKQFLVDHANQFGFTKAQVRRYARPMVVRTIRTGTDLRTLADWSRRLNMSMSVQLDATRLAVSRANFLDPRALDDLAALGEEETMASYLSSQRSQGLIRSLQHSNILDARSSAQYLQNGMLTPAGKDMVNDLLVAVIIPDAMVIQSLGAGTIATLARSSPYLISTRQVEGYDVTKPLQKALRDLVTYRNAGTPTVRDFYRQGGLFASARTETEGDPLAMKWLEILVEGGLSAAKFAKMSRRYLQLAREGATGQRGFFAVKKLTALQALVKAGEEAGLLKKVNKGQGALLAGVSRHLEVGRGQIGAAHQKHFFTREQIEEALQQAGWRVTVAAKMLGVSAPVLSQHMLRQNVVITEENKRRVKEEMSRSLQERRVNVTPEQQERTSQKMSQSQQERWDKATREERERWKRHSSEGMLSAKGKKGSGDPIAGVSRHLDAGREQIGGHQKHFLTREQIEHALREAGWRKSVAAKRLGISEATLYDRMLKYGIALTEDNKQVAKELTRQVKSDVTRSTLANLSPEKREARNQRQAENAHKRWDNLSPEERDAQHGEAMRQWWGSMPIEEREARSRRHGEDFRRVWDKATPEEQEVWRQRHADALRQRWVNLPQEEREAHGRRSSEVFQSKDIETQRKMLAAMAKKDKKAKKGSGDPIAGVSSAYRVAERSQELSIYRPPLSFAKTDTRCFEFREGNSQKFWEITRSMEGRVKHYTVHWGRLGTKGQTKKIKFSSHATMVAAYNKIVREKCSKGYQEVF